MLIKEEQKWVIPREKGRQDKESGQKANSRVWISGKPAFLLMTKWRFKLKRKEVEKSVDRHIRIFDVTLLEQIDKIMQYPEFKSFSKVINEALFIALPKILERLEGNEEITIPKAEEPRRAVRHSNLIDEEFYGVLVRLLKEIVLNAVINKSILSSLFHAVERLNKYCGLSNELYEQGLMSDTPDYLEDFETEQLKKMRR